QRPPSSFDEPARDRVAEFARVARPLVRSCPAHVRVGQVQVRRLAPTRVNGPRSVDFRLKMPCDWLDVFWLVSQRRHTDDERSNSVIQIFAELSFPDQTLEWPVRRHKEARA